MRIKDLEIMSQLKINLGLVMQTSLILKSMGLGISEVVVVSLQEKLLVEWQLEQ